MSNYMIYGGHFENMQIRPLRRHFSACQHWFSDSAYQITPNQGVKSFSSQNACTCSLFCFFFLTIRASQNMVTRYHKLDCRYKKLHVFIPILNRQIAVFIEFICVQFNSIQFLQV